jgi:hypothetical protein
VSALLKMNVSPRTALAIIVLAALVSLVATGREAPSSSAPPPETARAADAGPRAAPPRLELDKLERPALGEPLANLFATPRPAPAARAARPATAAPAAPAVPLAPPVPFRYLGKIVDGERTAVFLARNEEHFLAVPGATLAGQYRVEDITSTAITLVYLPLGTRQSVPIPARN